MERDQVELSPHSNGFPDNNETLSSEIFQPVRKEFRHKVHRRRLVFNKKEECYGSSPGPPKRDRLELSRQLKLFPDKNLGFDLGEIFEFFRQKKKKS